jgi:hypothetical protein
MYYFIVEALISFVIKACQNSTVFSNTVVLMVHLLDCLAKHWPALKVTFTLNVALNHHQKHAAKHITRNKIVASLTYEYYHGL